MSPKHVKRQMGRLEFVCLVAMMFATIAFSVDAMLPALPVIAAELSPELAYQAPLILTFFVLGMGAGTLIAGPLSDAYGRRVIVLGGSALYILAAGLAWMSRSLEVMLVARVLQGLGAAGPRVVSVAIIRDLFKGREMAQIVSVVMMIFTLVPALAPAMGSVIIAHGGWRHIFIAFILFSLLTVAWVFLRLPETLAPRDRRPLRLPLLAAAAGDVCRHPTVRLAILAQTLAMAMMFSTLTMVQPIYAQVFDRSESFPYWFGMIAVIAGSASLVNAVLVVRFGMQRMVLAAFALQILLSAGLLLGGLDRLPEPYGFGAFLVWQAYLFFQAGLTLGNLNAIAMEPMGHVAGMAASIVGASATVLASLIASGVGLLFDGTTRPLMISVLVMAVLAAGLVLSMHRPRPIA